MSFSFWSDEDWLFVPRGFGLGWTINFKLIARKLGLVKTAGQSAPEGETPQSEPVSRLQEESSARADRRLQVRGEALRAGVALR